MDRASNVNSNARLVRDNYYSQTLKFTLRDITEKAYILAHR